MRLSASVWGWWERPGERPHSYDAQVAYEAAGMTTADPAIAVLDPDSDGIACEEGM